MNANLLTRYPGLILIASLLLFSPASPALGKAEAIFSQLQEIGSARVIEIVDGDTVILDTPVEGATEVRLVGIQAPKLPLGRKNFIAWPLGSEAKAALSALTLNQTVTLYTGGQKMDRYGRHLAHLKTAAGVWVQEKMLSVGMARVYSFPDNRSLVKEMLEQETVARQNKFGIWAHPFYGVRSPADSATLIGRFEVIEGTILQAAKVKKRIYLNFGEDWRTDFTISIEKKNWKKFEQSALDLMALEGRTVRVRGWLKDWNGPSITVTHPEQIETLN